MTIANPELAVHKVGELADQLGCRPYDILHALDGDVLSDYEYRQLYRRLVAKWNSQEQFVSNDA